MLYNGLEDGEFIQHHKWVRYQRIGGMGLRWVGWLSKCESDSNLRIYPIASVD